MLDYEQYCKVNKLDKGFKSLKMFAMYAIGEEEIEAMNEAKKSNKFGGFAKIDMLACNTQAPTLGSILAQAVNYPGTQKQEVENTMTTINAERDYLARRLQNVKYTKCSDIDTFFKIHENKSPNNYKELIAWITEGKYELDKKRVKFLEAAEEDREDEDFIAGYGAFDGIIWTGRGKHDPEAYKAARDDMEKKYQSAMDTIKVLDNEAGLKALQDFESWTPKGKKH